MVVLQNAAQAVLTNVSLVMAYDAKLYRLPKPSVSIPVLLPGVANRIAVDVRSIDELGRSGVVRILVVQGDSTVPMVSAAVTMPRCEVLPGADA